VGHVRFAPRPLGLIVEVADAVGGELCATLDGDARHHDIVTGLLGALGAACILVLEDVHWADEATLDVVRRLGRRIRDTSGLVVATYRDDELAATHPLRMVLGDFAPWNTRVSCD
jgi:hypothetical protein